MNQAMVRRKLYHERKLKWYHFEVGEKVYVYFPSQVLHQVYKYMARAFQVGQKDM